MATFLANENVPDDVIKAARAAGIDLAWIREQSPGANDETVLALALADNRVLITFDKDFGELAFRRGLTSAPGVILRRPRLYSPDYLVRFVMNVLRQDIQWEGHFVLAQEGRVRVTPLPGQADD